MLGEICKTLKIIFSPDEVLLLKEVLSDDKILKIVEIDYGPAWHRATTELRNILVNA